MYSSICDPSLAAYRSNEWQGCSIYKLSLPIFYGHIAAVHIPPLFSHYSPSLTLYRLLQLRTVYLKSINGLQHFGTFPNRQFLLLTCSYLPCT
ncbi:hypothetical protein ACROYT_G034111 [Oculina patagonica]